MYSIIGHFHKLLLDHKVSAMFMHYVLISRACQRDETHKEHILCGLAWRFRAKTTPKMGYKVKQYFTFGLRYDKSMLCWQQLPDGTTCLPISLNIGTAPYYLKTMFPLRHPPRPH